MRCVGFVDDFKAVIRCRRSCRRLNSTCLETLCEDQLTSLLTALPKRFQAHRLGRCNALTVSALCSRRCSLCGEEYRGTISSAWGVWAHPKCVRGRVQNTYYLPDEHVVQHFINEDILPYDVLTGYTRGVGQYRYLVTWKRKCFAMHPEHTVEGLRRTDPSQMFSAFRERVRMRSEDVDVAIVDEQRRNQQQKLDRETNLRDRRKRARDGRVERLYNRLGEDLYGTLVRVCTALPRTEVACAFSEVNELVLSNKRAKFDWESNLARYSIIGILVKAVSLLLCIRRWRHHISPAAGAC